MISYASSSVMLPSGYSSFTIPENVIEKISDEASRAAFETLSDSDSGRFEVWHEDPDCRLDISCQVFGRISVDGDGWELPQDVSFSNVSVFVFLDVADPQLGKDASHHLTERIRKNIEEYLIA